jgi:hypothetical protein
MGMTLENKSKVGLWPSPHVPCAGDHRQTSAAHTLQRPTCYTSGTSGSVDLIANFANIAIGRAASVILGIPDPSAKESTRTTQRRRRRSLLRIVHARGAILNEMGPTSCRATAALTNQPEEEFFRILCKQR